MAFWGFWLHHLVRVIEIVLQAVGHPPRLVDGTIKLCDLPTRCQLPRELRMLVEHDGLGYIMLDFVSHGGYSYKQISMQRARPPLDRIDNPINPGTISRPP